MGETVVSWVITQNNPYFDEDGWRYDYEPHVVLVLTDCSKEQAELFVAGLNSMCDEYNHAVRKAGEVDLGRASMVEDLNVRPPYEFMVKILGPKPAYDHTRSFDKEYNVEYVNRVAAWRALFREWAKDNADIWLQVREDMARTAIRDVSTDILGADEYQIASHTMIDRRYSGHYDGTVKTPFFEAKSVETRSMKL